MEKQKQEVDAIIDTAMNKLKEIIDIDTIVGKPIILDNKTILPISRVSVGFVAGGGELSTKNKNINDPFAGGSGSGFVVNPMGFLVVLNDDVKYITCSEKTSFDELIKLSNKIINKISGDKNEK